MKTGIFTTLLLGLASTAWAQDQQVGARTKAMGGSYTAFEDDPVSVFLNPAGIATQADQFSISYQTYTAYPKNEDRLLEDEIVTSVEAESGLADPAFLPSYLGAVFQLGTPESPMALGVCFARPYHLHYAFDDMSDPGAETFSPDSDMDQALGRFRVAFAYDFRFREVGEAGFFTHLALGLGLDVGFVQWKFSGETRNESDTSTGFGFGSGR
jgi:hypothetical protein